MSSTSEPYAVVQPADGESPSLRPKLLGTFPQWLYLLGRLALLVVLVVAMALVNYEYVRLLWTHPSGIKISVIAVMLLLMDVLTYAVGCLVLNLTAPPGRKGNTRVRSIFNILIALVCLILFYVPVLFVVLMGSAYIQIIENLKPD